ncbi:MAG: ATP-binding protein [Caulobacteraceae bacterium]
MAAGYQQAEQTAEAIASLDLGTPMKGLSFQNRIAIVSLITAVTVLAASTGLFIAQEWRTDHQRLIQSQTDLAKVSALRMGEAYEADDIPRLQRGLSALRESSRVQAAYATSAQGVRIATFERPGVDLTTLGDRAVVTREPIVANGRKMGELVVTAAGDGMGSILPRFVALGGSLFFVAAGLALFLGRWLAAKVTKPVNRLSEAMAEVSHSRDFAKRVERGEDDEFGRLTDSFNALLGRLHHNDLDLRAAMDELVEARDAAEAANVLKSHFLANMSHEIRTPLNGVLAMSQIMAMGDLAPAQRERLEVISRSGESLLAILNDILDLSKIEAGRMELDPTTFTPTEMLDEVVAAHREPAEKKGLALTVDYDDAARLPRHGDRQRVLQIINNLAANAVKFTESGAVAIRVSGTTDQGAGLRISVADTGIGIAPDKLPMLFQKFSQLDSSTTRRFGGTGLGLAICRELAHLMGGRVWADSQVGKGSTFYVELPLAPVSGAAGAAPMLEAQPNQPRRVSEEEKIAKDTAAAANEPASEPAEGERPLKILAAEDNATNQLVLKSVMATFDVDLHLVGDGQAAVEAWLNEDFDVVLMDIQMPVMDGIAATRAIRAAEAETGRARTPIVALSANAMTHQVKEYLAAGMDRHVAKPIEIAKLHGALVAVLNEPAAEQPEAAVQTA